MDFCQNKCNNSSFLTDTLETVASGPHGNSHVGEQKKPEIRMFDKTVGNVVSVINSLEQEPM